MRTGAGPGVGVAGAGDVAGRREARRLPAAARAAEADGSTEKATEDDPTFEEGTRPVNEGGDLHCFAGDPALNDPRGSGEALAA